MNPSVKIAFDQLVAETGMQLKQTTAAVLNYTAERTAHVQANVDDPAFGEMVAAEARNVAQFAGIEAAGAADLADSNARGKVFGFLLALLTAGAV